MNDNVASGIFNGGSGRASGGWRERERERERERGVACHDGIYRRK